VEAHKISLCKFFRGSLWGGGAGWVVVQIEHRLQNPSDAGAGRIKNQLDTQMQQDIVFYP